MEEEPGVVREISWQDICPWIILFKSFRVAISVNGIVLSLGAILLITLGWNFAKFCFLTESTLTDTAISEIRRPLETWPVPQYDADGEITSERFLQTVRGYSFVGAFTSVSAPFRYLLTTELPWDCRCYFFFGGMFNLAIWAFAGLAICRISVVRFGRNEVVLLGESLAFAARKWFSCFSAPLIPLAGVFLLLLPCCLAGLLMRSDLGVLIVGIFWILIVVFGFAVSVLAIGLLCGWPFMWGTIASEGTDGFDAISRAYSYTYQRPLYTFFLAFLALLLGLAGSAVVFAFVQSTIELTVGGLAWGAGQERYYGFNLLYADEFEGTWAARAGVWLIQIINNFVRAAVAAFNFAFFWSASSAIYLLKRQQVDQTELDDIFFSDQERSPYGLPDLDQDEHGVPKASDQDA